MPSASRRQRFGQAELTSEEVNIEHVRDAQEHEEQRSDAEIVVDEDEQEAYIEEPEPFPPPGLKEISSLASWTVSTAKPGNGVAALRSPDMTQFWQSDGPQPHLLSIHFFKLVKIVFMRIFTDFENDESYTPTKIQFLAGMGAHDMHEFAEMELEQPSGWIEVDFSKVAPTEDDAEALHLQDIDWTKRPVLRAMVVQIKILENHQNGKDTHLRGVQIFARDEIQQESRQEGNGGIMTAAFPIRGGAGKKVKKMEVNIKMASWMQEPELR